ncbi:glycosyltransferase family 39 protein [Streptomyces tropicalis]|uniref:Glycosyltransferase family 39 protein n=1 Tax=Streptomyces tropicalis TaxID=3034234 RepID=A0ABT6AC67_9ACTN|nr:glycosyltransferase family 39 protein [Streptomyces tropicalis]MDF3302244.1 glycosyltransferase family 39 protein [Streptomyces tropicalis]
MTTDHDRTGGPGGTRPSSWGPPGTTPPGARSAPSGTGTGAPGGVAAGTGGPGIGGPGTGGPGTGLPKPPLVRRLWRGRPEEPRWARPALLALLLATGLLHLWDLGASGYANSFYSAAAQAGSVSWKAFFFGSLDAGNAITVDKPPAALWPMALAVRVLGLGSWAVLGPEAVMGVLTVAVVHASARRRFGPAAGLIAGAVTALTPVAALMFRFNNPDALLTLLTALTVHLVVRGLEDGRARWLLWAGVATGFAFLTKTLQAFLVLPPLAVLYGVRAPVRLRRRLAHLALAAAALVVSGGWWVAVVELWPASSRPYIGGSQHNSFLELTFGYNGLGRLNGDETGSVGGGGGGNGSGQWGETGWGRMFGSEVGGQVSWLLPAALILLVAGLVLTLPRYRSGEGTPGAGRTDPARGALLAWGGSLLTTAAVFSWMAGIFHQYYTVALAPGIGAVVGMGAVLLWRERRRAPAAFALAAAMTATAAWGYVLLARTPDYAPALRWLVLVGGSAAALGLLFAGRLGRRAALAVAAVGLAAALAGPAAYTLSTVTTAHTGSIPTAGPAGASTMGFGGGRGGGPGPGGLPRRGGQGQGQGRNGFPGGGAGGFPGAPGNQGPGGPGQGQGQGWNPGGAPGGGAGTGNGLPGGGRTAEGGRTGAGGPGGPLDGARVGSAARTLLTRNASRYTWVAASIGSQNAASYQLATGDPVMAIGGFNGTDPSPTLAQFQKDAAAGRIHWFIAGGGMGGGPRGSSGSGTAAQITAWVERNFPKVTAGSATFYDLTTRTG